MCVGVCTKGMNECEQSAAVSVNEIFDDEGKSRDGTFLEIIHR